MRGFIRTALIIGIVAGTLSPFCAAMAQTANDYGPKPLTALPDSKALDTKPADPHALPQEYVDLRQKVREEFIAWYKADQAIQKECSAPHSVSERTACDLKMKGSQYRRARVNDDMRDMLRKIDTWRRKDAGLPPPSWWPAPGQKTGSSTGAAITPPTPKPQPSVLLPQTATPLPAGTF